MTVTTRRYRWGYPVEWLREKAETADVEALRSIAFTLANALDSDQLQDLFQDEMSDDGYFTPLCDICDEPAEDGSDYCEEHTAAVNGEENAR